MESPAANISPKRSVRRRWRVPPAIMCDSEALEYAGVLEEHGRDAGLVLWQSLRDVTLWAVSRPSEREGLFSSGAEHHRIARIITAGLDPELEPPLSMITAMVGRPERVSAERVSLACRHVSQWAEQRDKLATALAFAQAAALACPGNASAAFKVGQIARRRAEYVRAETWFRRAIALGRQQGDWTSYTLSFVGLGNLYVQRGSLPSAKRLHLRGLRAARRHNLRDIQGRALHDLHVVATACGDFVEAQEFARAALECYGRGHPMLPNLAHDLAYSWLSQGNFAPALSVFQALLPCFGNLEHRIYLFPNIARAAGGLGDREVFEKAWNEVWGIAKEEAPRSGYAEALLEIARGASSIGQWDRADLAIKRAEEIAVERGEARIQITAEGVAQAIANERLIAQRIGDHADRSSPARTAADTTDETVRIAEEVVQYLEAHAVAV